MGNKLHRDKLVFRQDNSMKHYLETNFQFLGISITIGPEK